jgi:hypothetical protein
MSIEGLMNQAPTLRPAYFCTLCATLFQFLVFIPGNNHHVTKQIPMPFWVAGAWSIPASVSSVANDFFTGTFD